MKYNIRNINGITYNTEIQFLNLGDDNYITNPQDIADVLAETFEKNSNGKYDRSVNSSTTGNINLIMDHPDIPLFDSTLNSSITLEERNNILHTTKNFAPGPDKLIPNKL